MVKIISPLESTIREASDAYFFDFFCCGDGCSYELFAHDVGVTLIEKSSEIYWVSQITSLDAEPEAESLIPSVLSKHLLLLEFRTSLFLAENELKLLMVSRARDLGIESFVKIFEDFIFCTLEVRNILNPRSYSFTNKAL